MKDNLIKTLGVLLFTGVLCAGIAWLIQKNSSGRNLSASVLKSFADKDSDYDGLSDNLESVYGTNYMDADSDGDGYLDGEEVLSGYDPMKPSPGDQLDSKYAIMPRPAAGSMKDLNFTNDLVNKLTEKITSSEIQPQKIGDLTTVANPASVEESMEAAVRRSYNEFSLPDISADQLNISLDNSAESIKKYQKEVFNILTPLIGISAFDIEEGRKKTAELISLCENSAVKMKKLTIPSKMTAIHKKQIGLFIVQANILRALEKSEEDPLKAFIAFSQSQSINEISEEIIQETERLANF